RRVGFGAKGLVGGGRATTVESITLPGYTLDYSADSNRMALMPLGRSTPSPSPRLPTPAPAPKIFPPVVTSVRVRDSFFVAEPEANVIIGLTKNVRLTAGAGYRFIGTRERGRRNELDGATGSIALQIGGGG